MKTLITTFSGGGGFEAGAVAAGLTPVLGVECDAEIAGVYARNFGPHCLVSAVEDVDYSRIPTPWHHHTSPSCKKASVANKERGETAEDIAAARGVERAIRALRSPQFTLENVWGYRAFESFKIICKALEESGYSFGYWHLNAADYGVPQTRKRLILIASRTHRPRRPAPTHSQAGPGAQQDLFGGEPLQKWEGWYAAIEDLIPTLPESKFAKWQLDRLPEDFCTFLINSAGNTNTSESYAGRGCRTPEDPAHTVTTVTQDGGFFPRAFIAHPTADNDWFETRDEGQPIFTVKASAAGIPRAFIVDGKPANYAGELQIADGDEPVVTITASRPRHPFRAFLVTEQYRESNATPSEERTPQTFDPEQPSPSVMAEHKGKFRAWLEHGRVVQMTPRALARFQSFPDSYVLPEKAGLACKVIGNAVPSLLAQRIVESVLTMAGEKAA